MRWMLQRECVDGPVPDPCWRAMTTGSGLPFWISTATGDLMVEPPPQPNDFRGGFFCDEPGKPAVQQEQLPPLGIGPPCMCHNT